MTHNWSAKWVSKVCPLVRLGKCNVAVSEYAMLLSSLLICLYQSLPQACQSCVAWTIDHLPPPSSTQPPSCPPTPPSILLLPPSLVYRYLSFPKFKVLRYKSQVESLTSLEVEEPSFCGFYNPDYIIYSSLGSFYIPCLVMVVLYTRIFRVSSWCSR